MTTPISERDDLRSRSIDLLADRILALAQANVRAEGGAVSIAEAAFAQALGGVMALADVLARRRLRLLARAAPEAFSERAMFIDNERDPEHFGTSAKTVPFIRPEEAILDIATRTPVEIFGLPVDQVDERVRTAKEISDLYHRHAFGLAFSASRVLTQHVQEAIAASLAAGVPREKVIRKIFEEGSTQEDDGAARKFSHVYAETVYRTNVMSAYSAGQIREGMDPELLDVFPAWRFSAVDDADVRRGRKEDSGENHLAAHGFIGGKTDPAWLRIYPPLSYNCRCAATEVPAFKLRDMGLMRGREVLRNFDPFAKGAKGHPNFMRARPDLTIYA